MIALSEQDTALVFWINVVLGVTCTICWLCILGAIACDLAERRRTRKRERELRSTGLRKERVVIPDGWPPVGEELEV